VYRVTLGPETVRSHKCHVVRPDSMPPQFTVVAAQPDPERGQQACYTTPASEAPPQQSIQLLTCDGAVSEQLGTYCQMRYESTCEGMIWFYFDTPAGAPQVNWEAPVIDAVFKIKDATVGCLPNIANCIDEYAARLERLQ
jgi:hypothetical protein